MDEFEAAFSNASQSEEEFRQVVDEFGDFIPTYLRVPVEVPARALEWTR